MSNIWPRAQYEMIMRGGLMLFNNQHNKLLDHPASPASELPLHRLLQRCLFRHSHASDGRADLDRERSQTTGTTFRWWRQAFQRRRRRTRQRFR